MAEQVDVITEQHQQEEMDQQKETEQSIQQQEGAEQSRASQQDNTEESSASSSTTTSSTALEIPPSSTSASSDVSSSTPPSSNLTSSSTTPSSVAPEITPSSASASSDVSSSTPPSSNVTSSTAHSSNITSSSTTPSSAAPEITPSSASASSDVSSSTPPSSTSSTVASSSTTPSPSSVSSSSTAPSGDKAPNAEEENKIIYEGNVLTKQNKLISLQLNSKSLMWKEKGLVSIILLDSVIGVTTLEKFFTLHIIERTKKANAKKETTTFKCQTPEQAKTWADAINNALNQDGKGSRGCRVVFLVNPFSGTRKALSVLTSIRHLFDIAGMNVTVIETTKAGHAREIGRDIDLSTVDRLVCVSGDGLFNELLNGLLERDDWEAAVKMPLGIIPAGSGNGMAASLGTPSPISAALAVIKGATRPIDIIRTLQNGQSLFGFLSLTWAMISDVDIESDKLRWMGPIRFTVGALKRIVSLRKYKGRISILPAESSAPHAPCVTFDKCNHCKTDLQSIEVQSGEGGKRILPTNLHNVPEQPGSDNGWQVIEGEFVAFIATNVSAISTDFIASPHAHLSDGSIDLVLIRATPELTRAKLASLLLQTEDGKYVSSPLVDHYKVRALHLEPGSHSEREKDGHAGILAIDGERLPYGPTGLEAHRGLISMLYLD